MASKFVPRKVFHFPPGAIPSYLLSGPPSRSYVQELRQALEPIDLVVECRDFRIPQTSICPAFEEAVNAKDRLLLYTKRLLGGNLKIDCQKIEKQLLSWDKLDKTMFIPDFGITQAVHILQHLKRGPKRRDGGPRTVLVAGLPDAGQPNCIARVTDFARKRQERTIKKLTGQFVSIRSNLEWNASPLDTRGPNVVLQMLKRPLLLAPQVNDEETVLKLALCGSIKVPSLSRILLADYLLYHINKNRASGRAYEQELRPTNDIYEFLEQFGNYHSCYGKGGKVDHEFAARKFVEFWRQQRYAPFIFDDVEKITLEKRQALLKGTGAESIRGAWKVKRLQKEQAKAAVDAGTEV